MASSVSSSDTRRESVDSNGEIGKLKKELSDEKTHNAELKGQYLEVKEDFEKVKSKVGEYEKEVSDLKAKLLKSEGAVQNIEELEKCKKELAELKTENRKLENKTSDAAVALEQAELLQKQHEILVKENSEIKANLFDVENKLRTLDPNVTKSDSKEKLKIIEEIKLILSEVVYVYTTLDTTTKQFIAMYEEKKDKAQYCLNTIQSIEQAKKKDEQMKLAESLTSDVAFLQGFTLKTDNFKTIISCLKAYGEKKAKKLEDYTSQIARFTGTLNVSKPKHEEYEQKLALYY